MLNFIAIDLQLYKIFKIMQVSFFSSQRQPSDNTKNTETTNENY